ncbi:hypothetical protein NIES4101_81910 [Calothrix sp. NIES-4101]|nr:hypothetical protein NIES4101_81910 [Calothrix sp. NIES-4101]
MTLVSVTRLRLKYWHYLPAFMWYNLLSCWQIVNIDGFVGGKLIRDQGTVFWTVSAWKNQQAMQHYRNSGAHRQVMPMLQKWCNEAVIVHWEQADDSLPDMRNMYQRMVEKGKFTRLLNPSPAHSAGTISQPVSSKAKALPLRPRKNRTLEVPKSQV